MASLETQKQIDKFTAAISQNALDVLPQATKLKAATDDDDNDDADGGGGFRDDCDDGDDDYVDVGVDVGGDCFFS